MVVPSLNNTATETLFQAEVVVVRANIGALLRSATLSENYRITNMISFDQYKHILGDATKDLSERELFALYEATTTFAAFAYKAWIAERRHRATSDATIGSSPCQNNPFTSSDTRA